jgi:aspartate ammonia-lyase
LPGIHAARARAAFAVAGRPVDAVLIRAYGAVKLACCRANRVAGGLDPAVAEALAAACAEVMAGDHDDACAVDALAGGAGTALNLTVSEVVANRACVLLGGAPGDGRCDPLADANRHQSTNDTFPTALRIAAIRAVTALSERCVALQEAFQARERAWAGLVCLGRTEGQDAVLMTMGRRFGGYAEAVARDRWRLSKVQERLRVVNLGGTAIGTGLGAPRAYIFRVVDELRAITGLPLARAEHLVDGTANADAFAEVAGLLAAAAATLIKISDDLRWLAAGPEGGPGELRLPELIEGSSIMPGKINPVIPEMVVQAGLSALGDQQVIVQACARGCLEINPYLPLVADRLLTMAGTLDRAVAALTTCVAGIQPVPERIAAHATAVTAEATALATVLGHHTAGRLAQDARASGRRVRDLAIEGGLLTADAADALLTPAAVLRLGAPAAVGRGERGEGRGRACGAGETIPPSTSAEGATSPLSHAVGAPSAAGASSPLSSSS